MNNFDSETFNEAVGAALTVLPAPGLLLLSGDPQRSRQNLITIGWIQFGNLWNKCTVNVFIRKSRYSYQILQKNEGFSLNIMDVQKYKSELQFCATKSGKDCDKLKETGLTKIDSGVISGSSLKEASVVFECKIIFREMFEKESLPSSCLISYYPDDDFHQMIIGEVMNVSINK